MEVKVYNNVFENKFDTFVYDPNRPLVEQIEENLNVDLYKETLVECYDSETGETFYAPIEEDDSGIVILANNKSVDKDYIPNETDVINVFFTPMSGSGGNSGKIWGGVIGAVVGTIAAVAIIASTIASGGVAGAAWLPIILQSVSIFGSCVGLGMTIGSMIDARNQDMKNKSNKLNGGKEGAQSPDIRGAENTSIKNDNFPFVIGKHLTTARVIGDPITEYSGTRGEDAYVRTLLCVGYAPLKLTDFKLGDFWLCYNRDHNGSSGVISQQTVINGLLKGYSESGQPADSGDILDYWKHNDIQLEIIQQNPNASVDYGTVYPYSIDDQAINANVLYIADKALDEAAKVSYKGAEFPSQFRTNGVFFTAPCPRKFTITLQFPSGLYGTHTHTTESGSSSTTDTIYDKLALWMCIQWRIVNVNNPSSSGTGEDFNNWNTVPIGHIEVFDDTAASADKALHLGNDFGSKTLSEIYQGFLNKQLNSFGYLSGSDGLSEIRISATVTLTAEQCKQVIADTNPSKLIEIRCLRVSPNYMNQTSSQGLPKEDGMHSYSDLVKVLSITTEIFDEQELRDNDTLVSVRPLSERDMRKFCLVAIKAKADATGYLINQLKKVNCIAESFSPYWDSTQKKMFPENVTKKITYYGYYDDHGNKVNRSDTAIEVEVSKSVYEEGRNEGYSWYEEDNGSTYTDIIKNIVFDNTSTKHGRPVTYLSNAAKVYNNNSVSSGFMLGCVGAQNGPMALGYDEINMLSIGDWADKTTPLIDGTTFNSDTVYNGVQYHKNDLVPLRMEANGYVVSGMKLESVLEKLAICGRAMWCVDETGKIKVIMDAPADYVKGVISSQQCISSSNAFSFEKQPAGLFISFSDENDGYEKNQIYCWSDGNSINNYHGEVEPFNVDFVTNPYQMWSIGRYMLAYRVLQKEMLTRKIGPEGNTYSLGDVILIQSEDLLIGECSGRVQEILEDNGRIYGFISDATYEYEGILDSDDNSTQGVTIVQPGYLGKSKVVTLPIARANHQQTIGGKTYTQKKGTTNLVLFGLVDGQYGVLRSSTDPSDGNAIKYNMKTGDTCLFGIRDKISAPYRIVKIKPEKDGNFSETLLPYNEDLYQAGKMLPAFQNYITNPPVEDMLVSLSDVPTNLKDWNDSQKNVYNSINAVVSGGAAVGSPDIVGNVHAVAEMSKISITWSSPTNNGLKNTIKKYIVELSKDNGTTWTVIGNVYRSECEYEFDRTVDGYMEAADFSTPENKTWLVRVKAENVYGEQSGYSQNATIDVTNYGTYHPSTPEIISCAVNRDEIKVKWTVTNIRQPYASNIFKAFLYKEVTNEVYKGDWVSTYGGQPVIYNVGDVVYVESKYNHYICNTQHTAESTFDATEEANWTVHTVYPINVISNEYGTYTFDRIVDGYPEISDMQDWTVKILCYNTVYPESHGSWSVVSSVNLSNYGTWQLTQPVVNVKITDRTVILKLSLRPRNDMVIPYGDIRYKVFVKKHGVAEDWWKPAQTLDVYPEFDPLSKKLIRSNENNHRDSAVVTGAWTANTFYYVDDVVLENDVYYVCNEDHTSGESFDTDEQEKWATCNSTTYFVGDWTAATLYKIDDVIYESNSDSYYICNNEHVSESSFNPTEKANWDVYDNYLVSYDTYIQTLPLKGQGANQVENTPYDYKVIAFNEAGDCSTVTTVVATALITNIRDIVKARQDAKELYISELSALSANIGAILEGSLGDSSNMWDLSTFVDDNGVQHWKGKFRVGDENEYLYVEPLFDEQGVPTGHYQISFKMGSFEVTTQYSKINGELIVQENEDSLDRTRITPEGTFYEHRGSTHEESEWEAVAKQETRGLMSQSLYSYQSLVISNMSIAERRALGHDVGKPYLSQNAICYHFDTDFLDQNGKSIAYHNGTLTPEPNPEVADAPHLVDESDNTPGSVIDFKPAILSFSPYSEIGKAMYGRYSLTHPLGSHNWTIDFWMEYIWAEQQTLFDIGNEGDRIQIVVSGGDPYYNTYEGRTPEDPPYDYGTEYSYVMVYNNVMPAGEYIYHTSGTWEEHYTLEELIGRPSAFTPNTWQHFAFVLDAEKIHFYFDTTELSFDRKQSGDTPGSAIFNQEKNSFCLDELYIDTVAESFDSFRQSSLDKIPWGNISPNYKNFILDVAMESPGDDSHFYTNIFDGQKFADAVARIIGGVLPDTKVVIDAVVDGDMNAVTSNAVYHALANQAQASTITAADLDIIWINTPPEVYDGRDEEIIPYTSDEIDDLFDDIP